MLGAGDRRACGAVIRRLRGVAAQTLRIFRHSAGALAAIPRGPTPHPDRHLRRPVHPIHGYMAADAYMRELRAVRPV